MLAFRMHITVYIVPYENRYHVKFLTSLRLPVLPVHKPRRVRFTEVRAHTVTVYWQDVPVSTIRGLNLYWDNRKDQHWVGSESSSWKNLKTRNVLKFTNHLGNYCLFHA